MTSDDHCTILDEQRATQKLGGRDEERTDRESENVRKIEPECECTERWGVVLAL